MYIYISIDLSIKQLLTYSGCEKDCVLPMNIPLDYDTIVVNPRSTWFTFDFFTADKTNNSTWMCHQKRIRGSQPFALSLSPSFSMYKYI